MLWYVFMFSSFLKRNDITLYLCTTFVYSFIHRWTLGLLPPLATVNDAAMNMRVHMPL